MRIRITIRSTEVLILLNQKNKTQEWLARQMDTDPAHVHRIISKGVSLTPKTREKLQKIFKGTPWDKLFQIENE